MRPSDLGSGAAIEDEDSPGVAELPLTDQPPSSPSPSLPNADAFSQEHPCREQRKAPTSLL